MRLKDVCRIIRWPSRSTASLDGQAASGAPFVASFLSTHWKQSAQHMKKSRDNLCLGHECQAARLEAVSVWTSRVASVQAAPSPACGYQRLQGNRHGLSLSTCARLLCDVLRSPIK